MTASDDRIYGNGSSFNFRISFIHRAKELGFTLTKIKILLGCMAMCVLGVLPTGLLEAQGCVEHSHWYARSSESM